MSEVKNSPLKQSAALVAGNTVASLKAVAVGPIGDLVPNQNAPVLPPAPTFTIKVDEPVIPPAPKKQVIITGDVTRSEIDRLKEDINSSFEEVANMFLDLQRTLDQWEERLRVYNSRSSHKI